jgi:hypothetical protein
MSQARGYRAQLLVAFENTFGETPEAPKAKKMPINSAQIKGKQSLIESNTIRGRRDPAEPVKGNVDISGPLVVPVDEVAMGYWLKAMFGDPSTTGSGDPYIHVFKPGNRQPSLVIEQGFTDVNVYELYNGCKVANFSLTLGEEAELTATIELMGARETLGETSFASNQVELSCPKFHNYQASVQEDGSDIAVITSATLNIDFGLAGDSYALGSAGYRSDIPEGLMKITGNIKAFFENRLLLDKAVRGDKSSLKFILTNQEHSLELFLPEVIYERTSAGIEGAKGIMIELPFTAFYDNNMQEAAVIATLINGQASYGEVEQ